MKIEFHQILECVGSDLVVELVRTIYDQIYKYHNNVFIERNFEPSQSKYWIMAENLSTAKINTTLQI